MPRRVWWKGRFQDCTAVAVRGPASWEQADACAGIHRDAPGKSTCEGVGDGMDKGRTEQWFSCKEGSADPGGTLALQGYWTCMSYSVDAGSG